ncbi:hypothetical protein W02_02000 [Nitrospira sp. KM1]|uniref:hypothetical protein n=1 Tax=Nitrospira sp. KM1 TaxID=1936990 RepID=UPI0013A7ADA9|nr:hypothetical protein [Nitrospira sp. KM1]BCA53060.1 hypothetical protein W02_02000 [Nitrospira sp. KM1]
MRKYLMIALVLGGMTMSAAGCTTYYRVTDPTSGKAYYTTKVDESKGGAVKIKDDKSGSTVTLNSSEVKEISEDEYNAGLVAKAPAKQAPAQPVPAGTASPQSPASPMPMVAPPNEQVVK